MASRKLVGLLPKTLNLLGYLFIIASTLGAGAFLAVLVVALFPIGLIFVLPSFGCLRVALDMIQELRERGALSGGYIEPRSAYWTDDFDGDGK